MKTAVAVYAEQLTTAVTRLLGFPPGISTDESCFRDFPSDENCDSVTADYEVVLGSSYRPAQAARDGRSAFEDSRLIKCAETYVFLFGEK
jgi:hypothetical protein